jgi:peptide/nickel transport system ATP-binding protein
VREHVLPQLVEISGLGLEYVVTNGVVRALDGADLTVAAHTTLGVVGESGSGKSTLGLAIGRLLPATARRTEGSLRIDGQSVFDLGKHALRELRRERLGFVFQNPMTTLDPTMNVRRQLARANPELNRGDRIGDLLSEVGLPDVRRVARSFPHELSGGMAQRVAIALAVARRPALLIADEPTSALDATVREDVLRVLIGLKYRLGTSIMLLSHDLRMITAHCETVAVMYGGRVVEFGPSTVIFERPRHPYTKALLRAAPGHERYGERLNPIPGAPPFLHAAANGCAFAPRCSFAREQCRGERPWLRNCNGVEVLCHRIEEIGEACLGPGQ